MRVCSVHPSRLRGGSGSQPQRADIYTLGGESRATTNPTALVFDCFVSVPLGELNIVTCAPQSLTAARSPTDRICPV